MDRFYITTPIYYVNDAPHVGHAYCTVNADAMARWHRLIGDETKFLTGTDEHGQKVADAAAKHGMSARDWTDRTSARFKEAWDALDISYDDFIRTTEPRHYESVQKFLSAIYENGYIYKDVYKGLYCVSCEDYFTIEASVDGNCPIHGRPLIEMEEENWFFRLSAFEDRLLEHYAEHPDFVTPETKRNEAYSFIKGGLRDISITRTSISWGVPVPWDENHVFYVWYDALINYLTAIGYGRDDDEVAKWWPNSHHLIGKEIIRFHCVWWPAMCMAAGLEPVSHVQVHGWLLIGGQKLSKTMAAEGELRLSDISPVMLTNEFGVDPIRYYLLRETALGNDGEFSLEGITQRYNTDLANNLGNLVARVTTVVDSKCAGVGPAPRPGAGGRWGPPARPPRRGTTSRPNARSRPRGTSSARRTPTSSRTPRGRWSPASSSTRSWATPSRRSAWSRSWRRRRCPRCARRSGDASDSRDRPARHVGSVSRRGRRPPG
jgi:methionyl-tRNA synthetase